MNLKRIITRGVYYFKQGYGLYLTFPLAFISFVSTVYYLAIQNIPVLRSLFPHFFYFVMFSILVIPPFGVLLGYMHYKKLLSSFYKAQLDIETESNPYAMTLSSPVSLCWMKVISQLGKLHSIDTTELDLLIERTEKKFGLR